MCPFDFSSGVLLESDFKPEELGSILDGWDISNTERRGAALDKQRTEYSSVKNQADFANQINEAIL